MTVLPMHIAELLELTLRTGRFTAVTARLAVPKAPQELDAATRSVPVFATSALIVFVAETPLQPPGSVQV